MKERKTNAGREYNNLKYFISKICFGIFNILKPCAKEKLSSI